jgi:hypothetical protein
LGDEGEVGASTFLGLVVDCNGIHKVIGLMTMTMVVIVDGHIG